jgi:hypothetical protein
MNLPKLGPFLQYQIVERIALNDYKNPENVCRGEMVEISYRRMSKKTLVFL